MRLCSCLWYTLYTIFQIIDQRYSFESIDSAEGHWQRCLKPAINKKTEGSEDQYEDEHARFHYAIPQAPCTIPEIGELLENIQLDM